MTTFADGEAMMNKRINRTKLKEKIDNHEPFVLVEVLKAEAFDKMHLPGAINIPVDDSDFKEQIESKVPNKETEIVVYCWDTDCSASEKAASILTEMGYKNAYDYVEGKKDWKDAGLKVVKSSQVA